MVPRFSELFSRIKEVASMTAYVSPTIEEIAEYTDVTRATYYGKWRDIFGGRAHIIGPIMP